MSYQDPRYGAPSEPHTPSHQQQYQQPGYQQPGYHQPGYQQPGYSQPGYQQAGYQQPGYPQYAQGQGYYAEQPQPEPPKSRKMLAIMIPTCLVLLLLVSGSAYFFFFSGKDPEGVVTDYIEYAHEGDFASARSLTTSDATEGARFEGDGEQMEAMRRWFDKDAMTWSIRGDDTSAKYSTVTVDKTLNLEFYDSPIEMRWDYNLERDSGNWRITRADVMTKVDSAEPDNCLASYGIAYGVTDCAMPDADAEALWIVADEVEKPSDCPDPKGTKAEDASSNTILCLDEN